VFEPEGVREREFGANDTVQLAEPKTAEEARARCARSAMTKWRFPIPQSEYSEPRNARFAIDVRFAPP
jgi:hypothetical protein